MFERHHAVRKSLLLAALLFLAACSDKSATDPAKPAPTLADIRSGASQQQAIEAARRAVLIKPDAALPDSAYQKVDSGDQLMYLFYAVSGLPADMDKIANALSQDYRSTSDGFKKQDIVKSLQPRVATEVERAKQQRYVIWETDDTPIERYDFARKVFPVRPVFWDGNNSFYFYNNSNYHLSFAGEEAVRALKVEDEGTARQIEGQLAKGQRMRLRLYVFAQDVDMNSNTVKAQVVRIELLDPQGHALLRSGAT